MLTAFPTRGSILLVLPLVLSHFHLTLPQAKCNTSQDTRFLIRKIGMTSPFPKEHSMKWQRTWASLCFCHCSNAFVFLCLDFSIGFHLMKELYHWNIPSILPLTRACLSPPSSYWTCEWSQTGQPNCRAAGRPWVGSRGRSPHRKLPALSGLQTECNLPASSHQGPSGKVH